jgi:hypothetical protein
MEPRAEARGVTTKREMPFGKPSGYANANAMIVVQARCNDFC